MLEHRYALDEQSYPSYRSEHVRIKVADGPWEKQAYFRLRREVFAKEQKLLPNNEQDGQDFRAVPIIALATTFGIQDEVVGAVRIYPKGDDVWFGGRLCVAKPYRGFRAIGKGLINEAVSRAKDVGCTQFYAYVQVQNEAYFQGLNWHTLGYLEIAGRPHAHMQADVSAYPLLPRCAS